MERWWRCRVAGGVGCRRCGVVGGEGAGEAALQGGGGGAMRRRRGGAWLGHTGWLAAGIPQG